MYEFCLNYVFFDRTSLQYITLYHCNKSFGNSRDAFII